MSFELASIGTIHSPYKEKFAVPRQPGLVTSAKGYIELLSPYDNPDAFAGIEGFSHLWLIFVFHQTMDAGWRPKVRPPRLGGNEKLGVFATRSTFRPNPIGLSVVEFNKMSTRDGRLCLELTGLDLVDGTPILDIKPYVPYADAINTASGGFAQHQPEEKMEVVFSSDAMAMVLQQQADYPSLHQLIMDVLRQDPRPAYKKGKNSSHVYGVHLLDFNVRWQVTGQLTQVVAIDPAN